MAVTNTVAARQIPYRDPAHPLVKGIWVGKGRVTGDASGGTATITINVSGQRLDRFTLQDFSFFANNTANQYNVTWENWEDVLISAVQNYVSWAFPVGNGGPILNGNIPISKPAWGMPVQPAPGQTLLASVVCVTNTNTAIYEFVAWGYIYDADLLSELTRTPMSLAA